MAPKQRTEYPQQRRFHKLSALSAQSEEFRMTDGDLPNLSRIAHIERACAAGFMAGVNPPVAFGNPNSRPQSKQTR